MSLLDLKKSIVGKSMLLDFKKSSVSRSVFFLRNKPTVDKKVGFFVVTIFVGILGLLIISKYNSSFDFFLTSQPESWVGVGFLRIGAAFTVCLVFGTPLFFTFLGVVPSPGPPPYFKIKYFFYISNIFYNNPYNIMRKQFNLLIIFFFDS